MQLLIKEEHHLTDVAATTVDTDAVAKDGPGGPADGVDAELVSRLVERARAAGAQLTGEGGLLQQLTKRFAVGPGRSAPPRL